MKKNRTKLTVLLMLLTGLSTHAQLRVPVTNNDLRNNLEKVISGFPAHFTELKGDTLEDTGTEFPAFFRLVVITIEGK